MPGGLTAAEREELQDLYASLRSEGALKKSPEMAELAASLVKDGALRDLSGGSVYPEDRPKPAPAPVPRLVENVADHPYVAARASRDYSLIRAPGPSLLPTSTETSLLRHGDGQPMLPPPTKGQQEALKLMGKAITREAYDSAASLTPKQVQQRLAISKNRPASGGGKIEQVGREVRMPKSAADILPALGNNAAASLERTGRFLRNPVFGVNQAIDSVSAAVAENRRIGELRAKREHDPDPQVRAEAHRKLVEIADRQGVSVDEMTDHVPATSDFEAAADLPRYLAEQAVADPVAAALDLGAAGLVMGGARKLGRAIPAAGRIARSGVGRAWNRIDNEMAMTELQRMAREQDARPAPTPRVMAAAPAPARAPLALPPAPEPIAAAATPVVAPPVRRPVPAPGPPPARVVPPVPVAAAAAPHAVVPEPPAAAVPDVADPLDQQSAYTLFDGLRPGDALTEPGGAGAQVVKRGPRSVTLRRGENGPEFSVTRKEFAEEWDFTPDAARRTEPAGAPRLPLPPRFGKEATVYTPQGNEPVPVRYSVVEADDLIPSHTDRLSPNPRYDHRLQPRDRARTASEEQITGISSSLQPERLGESATTADGAPIIGMDRQVESGNGRTLAIRRAYQQGAERAAAYRQFVTSEAEHLGLDPSEVAGMKQPVLVRVRTSAVPEAERGALAARMGASPVAAMSATETAVGDAKRLLDTGMIERLVPSETGRIGTLANQDFVRQFVASLPESERASLMQSDGGLSLQGEQRLRAGVLASAYDDAPTLARMFESEEGGIKNVGQAMLRSAPKYAKLKRAMAQGTRYPLDISEDIAAAANRLAHLEGRKGGLSASVRAELAQIGMFGDDLSPVGQEVLAYFGEHANKPARLAAFLDAYADGVEIAGDPAQTALFGGAPPSVSSLLEAARRKAEGIDGQSAAAAPTLDLETTPVQGGARTNAPRPAPAQVRPTPSTRPSPTPTPARSPAAAQVAPGTLVAWKDGSRLRLGTVEEVTGTRAVVQETTPARRGEKVGRFSVLVSELQPQTAPAPAPAKTPPQASTTPAQARKDAGGTSAGVKPVQVRAKAGGEYGPNGEWYRGGAFIATTELPKTQRASRLKAVSGKKEIEPYKWEVSPPGKVPILSAAGAFSGNVIRGNVGEIPSAGLAFYGADAGFLSDLAARYAKGERYIDIHEYPQAVARHASWAIEKALLEGHPVPGEALTLLPKLAERYGVSPSKPDTSPTATRPSPTSAHSATPSSTNGPVKSGSSKSPGGTMTPATAAAPSPYSPRPKPAPVATDPESLYADFKAARIKEDANEPLTDKEIRLIEKYDGRFGPRYDKETGGRDRIASRLVEEMRAEKGSLLASGVDPRRMIAEADDLSIPPGSGPVPRGSFQIEPGSRPPKDFALTDLVRSPLSIVDAWGKTLQRGSYERIGGTTGKAASEAFREAQRNIEEYMRDWDRRIAGIEQRIDRARGGTAMGDLAQSAGKRLGQIEETARDKAFVDFVDLVERAKDDPERVAALAKGGDIAEALREHDALTEDFRRYLIEERRALGIEMPDDWGITDKGYFRHLFLGDIRLFVDGEMAGVARTYAEAQKKAVEILKKSPDAEIVARARETFTGDGTVRVSTGKFWKVVNDLSRDVEISKGDILEDIRGVIGRKAAREKRLGALLPREGKAGYSKAYADVMRVHAYQVARSQELTKLNRAVTPLAERLRKDRLPGLAEAVEGHLADLWGTPRPWEIQFGNSLQNVPMLRNHIGTPAMAFRQITRGLTRAQAFAKLTLSIKAPVINLVQPYSTLWPYMSTKDFVLLYVEAARPSTIRRLREKGVYSGNTKLEGTQSRVGIGWTSPFNLASQINRGMGYLHGEKMAKMGGLTEAAAHRNGLAWAERVEFDNSKWNAPPVLRTPQGRILGQFKGFSIKMLENLAEEGGIFRPGSEIPRGQRAARAGKFLGAQAAVGGVKSFGWAAKVVGGTAILILLKRQFQHYGMSERDADKAAQAVYYGAPSLIGADISGSVAILEEPYGRTTEEKVVNFSFGPTVGSGLAIAKAWGNPGKIAEKLSPLGKSGTTALQVARKGLRGASVPVDRKEMALKPGEAVLRMLGFTPVRQTRYYDEKEYRAAERKRLGTSAPKKSSSGRGSGGMGGMGSL